jgi:putative protease
VTVNIYAHNEHLKKLPAYLKKINIWKPDALIISDPGIILMAKKYCPKIDIHLSTQANATNWQAVKFWQHIGVKRVILGREVTLSEIKEIHKQAPKVELEYFVHGAMCMSYSGRCMLSAWLTGRSANLGDCAQPCRWKYKVDNIQVELTEPLRPNEKIPVEEDQNGTYIFNSKDLCLIEYLGELVDAGIVSFKIEGRAKSVSYLSAVVKTYRDGLIIAGSKISKQQKTKKLKALKKNNLDQLLTRGYTTGFLFGRETVEQNTEFTHIGGEEKFVGEVVDYEDGKVFVKPHNAFFLGDKIKIIRPNGDDLEIKLKKLYNTDGLEVKEAHGGTKERVYFESKIVIPEYSILQKII